MRSSLDDILGGLLGGKGGSGGLDDLLSGLSPGTSRSGAASGVGGGGGLLASLLPMLGAFLASGGLNKILSGLQARGLSAKSDSWIGLGPNEALSASEVEDVISEEELTRLAEQVGASKEETAAAIADVLPQLVDRVSPAGELPPEEDLDQVFDRIASLSGVR